MPRAAPEGNAKTGTALRCTIDSPGDADWLPVQATITGFEVAAAAAVILPTSSSLPCVAITQASMPSSAISVSRIGANDGLFA